MAKLLYWIGLACTGIPNKVASEFICNVIFCPVLFFLILPLIFD